ncbi:MAG TPA: FAD-binding oxidoreductase [Acetobacteraceae bacterium]|nr:FAD-binding oxidoreductase [Acetobacteraceae bacterium]
MHVAVVGAGIVGVCCALHLRHAGHDVTLLDPRAPGTATSFGNAGGIVAGSVVPNSTPALRRNLRRILLDRDSPVRVRWSYLPQLTPWLARFLREGSDARVRQIAQAMHPLSIRAYQAHRELIALSGADGIVRPLGWMKVYATEAGFADTQYDRDIMTANSVRFDVLQEEDIRQLEPALAPRFVKGLLMPDGAFVSSPYRLTAAYVAQFQRMGGVIAQERVRGIRPEPAGVTLDCELGYRMADAVVIAAGAWSKELVRQIGDRVMLDTERGYHLNLAPGDAGELRRAVVFADQGGFVLAPMQDGIRLTSGVELAGLNAPPDFAPIRRLLPRARQVLPGLSDRVTRQWMGYRPSTPDSLPVIGRSPRSPHVYYAFGHQHLGLTLSAITGRLVAALIGGGTPEIDIKPYRIERF